VIGSLCPTRLVFQSRCGDRIKVCDDHFISCAQANGDGRNGRLSGRDYSGAFHGFGDRDGNDGKPCRDLSPDISVGSRVWNGEAHGRYVGQVILLHSVTPWLTRFANWSPLSKAISGELMRLIWVVLLVAAVTCKTSNCASQFKDDMLVEAANFATWTLTMTCDLPKAFLSGATSYAASPKVLKPGSNPSTFRAVWKLYV
jgi:hypothetical protein